MPKINFLKMSGAGNDFIIIDCRDNNYQFSAEQIAKISNRHNIGCDQFILLKEAKEADILMEIYNSDGSKSGACGNATRCVAAVIMAEQTAKKVNIKTECGILNSWQEENGLIAVNMGKPKLSWQEIPLANQIDINNFKIPNFLDESFASYDFSAVNMGNPHIITFISEDLSDEEFLRVAPKLENHPLFPQKTNIEFVRILSPNHIKVRVWERGAGETLACGSGACAAVVAALQKDLLIRDQIKVSFKGGDLFIKWLENNDVIMSGNYQKIFSGIIDDSFL